MSSRQKCLILLAISYCVTGCMLQTVKVSGFHPDKMNATKAAQQALNSGAKKIVFDNPGFDYLVEPLFFHSNCEIVFEDGVVVRALPGAYLGRNDCLFTGRNAENVVICGVGKAKLVMNKKDYQAPAKYRLGEWRHSISLLSCSNITIKDLTIASSGGDGVYVSTSAQKGKFGAPCRNILLENLIIDDHHRQGISVISAEKLLIRNCKLMNTSGTQPMCGIDFEPNNNWEKLVDCVVEDCEFSHNGRGGIFICTGGLDSSISITVRRCLISGNISEGINVSADRNEKPNHGTIRFEQCKIADSPIPLMISDNRGGVKVSFTDCEIDNHSGKAAKPVFLVTQFQDDFSGIDFGNFIIHQDLKHNTAEFISLAGAGLECPLGEIVIVDKNGARKNFDLEKFATLHRGNQELKNFKTLPLKTAKLHPKNAKGKSKNPFRLRGKAIEFVQYADGKNPIEIGFETIWAPEHAGKPAMPVEIFDPVGTPYGKFIIDTKDFVYRFKPVNPGVYRFKINSCSRSLHIYSSAPGHAFGASHRLGFFRCQGTLYFLVPAGVKKFAIEIYGSVPNEPVEASVIDPDGKIRVSVPYKTGTQIMSVERKNSDNDEIWSVNITRACEDWALRLGAPLPPFLYTSPENLLIIK